MKTAIIESGKFKGKRVILYNSEKWEYADGDKHNVGQTHKMSEVEK